MRRFGLTILTLAVVLQPCISFAQEITPIIPPGGKKIGDVASYGIGYNVGMDISQGGITAKDVVGTDFLAGLLDALSGKSPTVQPQAIQAAMQVLGQKITARKQAEGAQNQAAADKFLEANKKKDGIQTMPSGLQYQVIKAGSGETPTTANTVSVHYEGKLLNGKVFDSSIARGEPATFPVTGVIQGWTQALLRMKVGDKWKLFVPPNLAYGENPRPGGEIGVNEMLIFEVELLEVK